MMGRGSKHLLRFVRTCGAGFILGVVILATGVVLSHVLAASALAFFVRAYTEQDWSSLLRVLVLLGILCLAVPVLMGVGQLLIGLFTQQGLRSVRDALYRKAIRLPSAYFDRRGAEEIHSVLINDSRLLGDSLTAETVSLATMILSLATAIGVLSRWNWLAVIFVVFLAIVAVVANVRFPRLVRDSTKQEQEALAQVMATGSGLVAGIETIKGLSAERNFLAHVERVVSQHQTAVGKRGRTQGWARATAAITGHTVYPVVKLGGGLMAFRGMISPSVAISTSQLASQTVQPFTQAFSLWSEVQRAFAASERVSDILHQEEDPYIAFALPAGNSLPWIELDRVTFSYPGSPIPALVNLTLRARQGQVLAIVGETGSGKSTLLKLISGLYEVSHGEIRVGSSSGSAACPGDLRQIAALCPQDLQLFPLSIAENLEMVRPGCVRHFSAQEKAIEQYGGRGPDDSAVEILRAFRIPELIAELVAGWDTPVNQLSGGQRQRIAVARAFLKPASIVVLDEPTSHLDADTEQVVTSAIRKLAPGRIIIVATHRVVRLDWVDRIIVLDRGRIVQTGTFAELCRVPGLFATLYARQSRAAVEAKRSRE